MIHYEKTDAHGEATLATFSGYDAQALTVALKPFHEAFATVPNARGGTKITFYDVEGMGDVTLDICDPEGWLPIRQLLDRNHTMSIAAQTP